MRFKRNGRPFSLSRGSDRFFLVGAEKIIAFPFFENRKSRRNALSELLRKAQEVADVCDALSLMESVSP